MCFACVNEKDSHIMNMGYDNEKDISALDNSQKTMGVSHALKAALVAAKREGRMTTGLMQAGLKLDMNPEGIMYTILPEDTGDDVTLHIHTTLIEAFCWENDIPLLKVDSIEKLGKILGGSSSVLTSEVNANDERSSVDYNCILVEFPKTEHEDEEPEVSEDEEAVIEFYKDTCETEPQPIVNLDV